MENLKKIMTIAFIGLGISVFAQDNTRMDKIEAIANAVMPACESGPQSVADLDDKMKENASLYGEYYKQKDYKMAIKFWRPLYFSAPKYSQNLHLRGIKMYKAFAKKAEGELKEAYLDSAYAIHEVRIKCFGSSAKLEKSKAFDWYSYRLKNNDDFVYQMFNNVHKVYTESGSETDVPANFLLYWIKTAIRSHKNAKTITEDDVLNLYETITNIAETNMSAGNEAGAYKATLDAVTEQLNKYKYLDCEKLIPLAEKAYRANPDDESTIIKTYNKLKAGKCTDTPLFTEVVEKLVKTRPTVGLYKFIASKKRKDGKTAEAIDYLNKAVALETEDEAKGKLYYQIAKTYLSSGSLSKAREYARKLLSINPNSGEAYLLIGNTYASSGKICGSGTDFKSHTVAWAAIDTWNKAKSVDPSVASEAQKLINKYTQYMPSKEELFYEGIAVGSSYTISCLGVTTIVRASN